MSYPNNCFLPSTISTTLFTIPPILEIGCGNGHFLIKEASSFPAEYFIGCDIKISRLRKAQSRIQKADLSNISLFYGRAEEFLLQCSEESLRGVHINFPDPWWKKRHHKRRFFYVQQDVDHLADKLQDGGFVSFISDHEEYFHHAFSLLSYCPKLKPEWESGYKKEVDLIVDTIFSRKWQQEGKYFFQTLFRKVIR